MKTILILLTVLSINGINDKAIVFSFRNEFTLIAKAENENEVLTQDNRGIIIAPANHYAVFVGDKIHRHTFEAGKVYRVNKNKVQEIKLKRWMKQKKS